MNRITITIVFSQFVCTSLWFAGNAILPDITDRLQVTPAYLGHLTSAVQFGFISGTLVFALLTIADRFPPSRVFFISALIAAAFNATMSFEFIGANGLLCFRFLTGFFLAGIYPVGMKIASDYHQKGLGKLLGLLVGALVLGTAFPHALKSLTANIPWKQVVYFTSMLASFGGLIMMLFVPDGPYRKAGQALKLTAFLDGFRIKEFRSAAFGYFGHMWEVYTFWAFVPVMLTAYNHRYAAIELNVPLWSFFIIAAGGAACVIGGVLSQTYGAKRIATIALTLSCLCCVVSPLFLFHQNTWVLLLFLLFWSMVVVADSPLFSSLVALYAPAESRGTSLTAVTCIGFAITIISIQVISALITQDNSGYIYTLLAAGPVLGLAALFKE
jgi:MFS family permease